SVTDGLAALFNWEKMQAPSGAFEAQDLEFKMTADRLGDDKSSAEFAKDVAAMANAAAASWSFPTFRLPDRRTGTDLSHPSGRASSQARTPRSDGRAEEGP